METRRTGTDAGAEDNQIGLRLRYVVEYSLLRGFVVTDPGL